MRMEWQVPSHAQDFWAPSTFCGGQSLDLVSLLPGDAHSSLGLTCFVYNFPGSWERYQKSQKNSPVMS